MKQLRVGVGRAVDGGGDWPAGQQFRFQPLDRVPQDCPAVHVRIEPGLQAAVVQDQPHSRVDVGRRFPCRFGDDRAAGPVIGADHPDAGHEYRFPIFPGEEPGLLSVICRFPLVPAVGRHQAAVLVKRVAEIAAAFQVLGLGVDRLRRAVAGPVRPVTPPEPVEHKTVLRCAESHAEDVGARHDVVRGFPIVGRRSQPEPFGYLDRIAE